MDDDRPYNSADYYSGSDTADDEIDSDIEDKLYAAVFHSNDILSSKSQEVPGYNNFTTLTDVIGSWKNIPSADRCFLNTTQNSGQNNALESESAKSSTLSGLENDVRYEERGISELENSLGNEKPMGDSEPCNVLGDKEARTDIGFGMEDMREKDAADDRPENEIRSGKTSPEKKIKKQRSLPKKSGRRSDTDTDYARRNDASEGNYSCAENEPRNNSVIVSPPGDAAESSDIKTEEELDKDEPVEKERRISLIGNESCAVEEGTERPSSIKPEEELKEQESIDKGGEVKPDEEQVEKGKSIKNRASGPSDNSSATDSSSDDSSSSSSEQETQEIKDAEDKGKTLPAGNEWNEIITLDDSEGSICEVPVPPKPRPPTINLEDSESSTSSDSSTSTEVMTPEKLVESYRIALSESKGKKQKAGGKAEPAAKSKRARIRGGYVSASSSDDSMTESEEENWGIIAGSQISKDKHIASSITDVRIPEITDNLSADVVQQDDSCQIVEDADKRADLVRESQMTQSQIISTANYSDITKETSSGLSSENSLVVEEQLGEEGRLFPGRETLAERNEEGNSQGNDQNVAEDDTLLINAEIDRNLINLDRSREPKTSTRTSGNRKRPVNESVKQCKHPNSPKKARTSDDLAVAGPSNSKSLREDKDNTNKQRNSAADYFFKPMNSEMENYYNKSWGGESFDIDAIRRQMPRDPRHWAVLNEDLLGYQQRRSRYWTESKCRNCNHTGHRIADCPEKRKLPSCHMCGAPGHREPRCPHKMCLGCGKKQNTYMQVCNGCRRAWCNGCQSYGHLADNCPDLWRRYHVTTSYRNMNTHLSAEDVMKPKRLLSCCNCAARGHDSTTCDNYRWSRHFPTPSYVTNYTTGPTYGEHRVLEDVEFPYEAMDTTEEENMQTDGGAAHTSRSSNEEKKSKSNTNEVTKENEEADEFLQSGKTENVEKNVKKAGEEGNYNEEETEQSNEPIPTNPEIKTRERILFAIKSQLLDAELEKTSECVVLLSSKQYGKLVTSTLSREFLQNLISQFPAKLEIKCRQDKEIVMSILSTRDLYYPIYQNITDWLKLRLDEQGRFMTLNLPTNKEELAKLLRLKLGELKQDLGDPFKLYAKIRSLRWKQQRLQRRSMLGTKNISSKRAQTVEQMANSQCRLNMILFGQVKVQNSEKSSRFLRSALLAMEKPSAPSNIGAAMYLQIVHHYNIIFAAYTPEKLDMLMDIYFQRYSRSGNRKKKVALTKVKKVGSTKDTAAAHANFIKELNRSVNNPNADSLMTDDSIQVIQQSLNSEREAAYENSPNCNGVESQFVVPGVDLDDANHNLHSNLHPDENQPIYAASRLEENHNSHRHGIGTVQGDYITLDNRRSQTASGKRKSRRLAKLALRNLCVNNAVENGFENNHGNSSQGRGRAQEGYPTPRNTSSQDMFFSDTWAQQSQTQNLPRNDMANVNSRTDIERWNYRHDVVNNPSTSSGIGNELRIRPNNRPGTGPEKEKSNNSKNKKKNKKKKENLPLYLQKRAGEKIAKYVNVGLPCITNAAKALLTKLGTKDLTLKNVTRFEKLVLRKLKKTDHLL